MHTHPLRANCANRTFLSGSRAPLGRLGQFRVYALICGFGLVAVIYLVLLCRSAQLDTTVGEVDQRIQVAEWELLIAKRELYQQLTPRKIGGSEELMDAPAGPASPEVFAAQDMPALEPSIFVDLAGTGTVSVWRRLGEAEPPEKTRIVSSSQP